MCHSSIVAYLFFTLCRSNSLEHDRLKIQANGIKYQGDSPGEGTPQGCLAFPWP